MYHRILVALDGGEASDVALDHAIVIAQATGAEVEVMSVVDESAPFLDMMGTDPVRLAQDLATAGEGVVAAAATRLNRAGVRYVTRLLGKHATQQDIAATIVAEADDWLADLIVMGDNGHRGITRPRISSVVREVMALSSQPLLLARSRRCSEPAPE
ncbi:universal stress protein [Cupriavidus sp. WKF15]|uniref:universal stress protein n=1 Tax=Cupriavidus sp. WKF15 TaxID=3032282 RepID=UPI0023E286C3|nr:universal stress protein [Cupriavidus sp. WKF15]WER44717.1 universal stress protein [Cupriavidus sp. WKF15]